MHYLRIVLFIIIFVVIDMGIGAVLRPYYGAVTLPAFSAFYEKYVATPTPVDVVFFGDSRFQHGIDSPLISKLCDCTARNISVSGSNMVTTYYQLRDFIETNTPGLVVLGVHWSRFAPQTNGHHYPFLLEMQPGLDALEYVRISRDIDFTLRALVHSYRYQEALPRFLSRTTPEQSARTSGDEFTPIHEMLDTRNIQYQIQSRFAIFDRPIDRVQVAYFRKTLALLKDESIPFVVVHGPELVEIGAAMKHDQELSDVIVPVVVEHGGVYITLNTNDELLTHERDYYADLLHLNARGAALFSEELWRRIMMTSVR